VCDITGGPLASQCMADPDCNGYAGCALNCP
jgi:hypothetical protein